MRENLPKTVIVKLREKLLELLSDPANEVMDILNAMNDVLYVTYRNNLENIKTLNSTNVMIAAYTTAQARLLLYDYIDKLGERVFYYDTDSCVYISGENED